MNYLCKNKSTILLGISFISGFSIMAAEISASRLLAPYFGTSVFVWTNIIGVIMLALSAGYFFGGKLADRMPHFNALLKLLFFAGFLFLLIPIITAPLIAATSLKVSSLQSPYETIFLSSLIFTVILFFFPILILGMTSPFIMRLYLLQKKTQPGTSIGLVSATSTIGSILGTFLPTLYFIPNFGTKITINIFALSLICIGIFGFKKRKFFFFALAAVLIVILLSKNVTALKSRDSIFENESAYQFIKVRRDLFGTNFLSVNEGRGVQSIYNKNSILTGYYFDYFNVLPNLIDSKDSKKILIVGLSGGTVATQLRHFYGENVTVDGVEIDPEIINVAKKYFAIENAAVNIINSDGRIFLQENEKVYDLIIVDAYAQEFYIPWTLTTREFWQLTNTNLSRDGILALNISSIDSNSKLLRAITNTLSSVFTHAYLTNTKEGSMNYILTAANRPLDFNQIELTESQATLEKISFAYENHTEQILHNSKQPILTDDKAPVEKLTDQMLAEYSKK